MSIILKILTVAGLASVEMYAAIPAGFAFKLSAWVIFFSSLVGGIAGVFVAAFLGDKIRSFIAKYRKPSTKIAKTNTLAHRIWNKYGVIGLGTIGTFFVGAPVCIALGVGLNANVKSLIFWCCIGVLARCIVFTIAGHFGTKLF
jgi:membrane protein YqaA with SNARE-associated domain